MVPLPLEASDVSFVIAEKEPFRSLTERATLEEEPELDALAEVEAEPPVLEVVLLELQPAATRSAAAAAAAVSPTRADTEYNGVPRSFTQTCRERHVRDQIRITRPQLT